jgi:hypothetical protein
VCRGDPDKGSFAGESRWRSAAQPLALALCRNKVVLAADVANAQPQVLSQSRGTERVSCPPDGGGHQLGVWHAKGAPGPSCFGGGGILFSWSRCSTGAFELGGDLLLEP